MDASIQDLLRLVILPVLGYTAWLDVKTRRVPKGIWFPVNAFGVFLLTWDIFEIVSTTTTYLPELYFTQVGLSLFVVLPITTLFAVFGGYGWGDAKAFISLAIILPTYPVYITSEMIFPMYQSTIGVMSFTILTNTVIIALLYPIVLFIQNLFDGFVSPTMFVGQKLDVKEISQKHGKLLEDTHGTTTNGLDLDVLRMYLQWRDISLPELRKNADQYRTSVPRESNQTGDGMIADGGQTQPNKSVRDSWGVGEFVENAPTTYGMNPEEIREGLSVVSSKEEVIVTPGIPFLVPVFVGSLIALTLGDIPMALTSLL